jgi:hypothetical protein
VQTADDWLQRCQTEKIAEKKDSFSLFLKKTKICVMKSLLEIIIILLKGKKTKALNGIFFIIEG